MDKCVQKKRFYRDRRLQVYMYDFMCVDPGTIPEEEYFPDTKRIVENYKKRSTPGPDAKYWPGFSYVYPEDYWLDLNFDET